MTGYYFITSNAERRRFGTAFLVGMIVGLISAFVKWGQFDALVSFTFNLGSGNLRTSTLLKKLNNGDYAGAAGEFLRWVNTGGKRIPGLVLRREAEKTLFEEQD